ncbi:class F sortase [Streptomyces chiangmaiensis]|uniref:Class F sortase n=1 Tax=Streptomyces chiangmaiensis TaxID=766497 RepID=A0ABU7FUT4_9ACTN|nr:class F sortase [Streptomyces chiangmaiensis]MED7826869.1 class F sortase [Streptomyces chiangmaiensis]
MSASGPADEEGRQKKRAPWGMMAIVLLTGLALVRHGSGQHDAGPPQPAAAAGTTSALSHAGAPAALQYSVVSRVRIPAIQVDAPVVPVGLDMSGWVSAPPPESPNLAGWFTGGVSPGEKGTAVIVGHVDNKDGPAVFYGLGALKRGDRVEVRRLDRKTAVFEIYGNEVFDKTHFPGDRVYGSKGTPELRVITCGGGFSEEHGYAGNVVVFARMVEVR